MVHVTSGRCKKAYDPLAGSSLEGIHTPRVIARKSPYAAMVDAHEDILVGWVYYNQNLTHHRPVTVRTRTDRRSWPLQATFRVCWIGINLQRIHERNFIMDKKEISH